MLKQLRLHNFKCFLDQTIDLGGLTLLTGMNGQGKSSVIQGLMLLYQSDAAGALTVTGPWVDLGSEEQLLSTSATEDQFFVEASGDGESHSVTGGEGMQVVGRREKTEPELKAESVNRERRRKTFWGGGPQYLTADRLGPQKTLPYSERNVREGDLGRRGEYTAHVLAERWQYALANEALAAKGAALNRLGDQVDHWMNEISSGVHVHPQVYRDLQLTKLSFSFPGAEGASDQFAATHVGFGLSYTLPVVAALLLAPKGGLVVLENPEAHLHPKGQSRMGRLIALAVESGVQVVVESHSDHVLDGIRIAVKNEDLKPENCAIHYFARSEAGETEVTSPIVEKDGRLDKWPRGFFDEATKNLAHLARPKRP
jgi:predicted ATPase